MKTTLGELIDYIKHPELEKDPNTAIFYRLKKFASLFFICLGTSIILTIIISFLEESKLVSTGKHSVEQLLKDTSGLYFFIYAVIFAPLIEELIFRAPLTLFKKPNYFRISFYTFAILFGFLHVLNYEITSNILVFSPILIAPQLCIGLYLGFIRIRFGLLWSIALHATYNGFLAILFLLAKNAITQI